jgi:hypothetical protein
MKTVTGRRRRLWRTVLRLCILLFATAGVYLGYLWIVVAGETARKSEQFDDFVAEPFHPVLFPASLVAIVVALVLGAIAAGQLSLSIGSFNRR